MTTHDADGETVVGHIANAICPLRLYTDNPEWYTDADLRQFIAGARARLDKAEAMLTTEENHV